MKKYYAGSHVCAAWTGARSFLQLFNPVDSGVILRVSRLHLAWSGSGSQPATSGFDLRETPDVMGTFAKNLHDLELCAGLSKAAIRYGNCPANQLPPNSAIFYEPWPGPQFNDKPYPFGKPDGEGNIVLMPGKGFAICAAHDFTYTIASFQASEEPIPE